MWLQDHICFGRRYSRVRVTMERFAIFRLTAFGTFPILRPIFHKMKNAGRVILDSKSARGRQEGQQNTNRLAQSLNEQLIYRSTTLSHRLRRCQLPFREHIKVRVSKYNYISPERGDGCEHSEQTEGLGYSLFTLCKLISIHVKKDYNHV